MIVTKQLFRFRASHVVCTALLSMVLTPSVALAERVLVVPFSQKNISLPHPAHEGAYITLKAYVRDADCNSGYDVVWDANRDGNYADDRSRRINRDRATNTVWEIGRTYIVPNVDRDTSMNFNVRVVDRCDNAEFFGTYKLFVYDFRPSNDPRNWTREQLDIMTAMAAQETMWFLHRTANGRSGVNTSTIVAQNPYSYATGLAAWFFAINGHLPAYPPGTINAHGHQLPDGWAAQNDARWNNDPYAETAMRFVNWLLARSHLRNIAGGEEQNTCGYNADRSVRNCNRLPATGDNRGGYTHQTRVYVQGVNTGSLSPMLAALAGTPIQHGGFRGWLYERFIQQMVDALGYQQIDSGRPANHHSRDSQDCSEGGWIYGDINGGRHCGVSDGSTSQWAYIGLESAEVAGGRFGVFVNNRHKYRIAENLIKNQRGDGGSGYRNSSGRGDFKLTGGALVAARWLGVHRFSRGDNVVPFPNESPVTRDRLRQAYDTYLSYTSREWNARRSRGSHWADSLFEFGDHLCGNTNAIYNAGRCGSTYAMYSHQKGFRTGTPELERVGNHDWITEFGTYYVRAQRRRLNANDPWANYGEFGQVADDYCHGHSVTCVYGAGNMSAAMAGLVLTPTIFNPKPIAIAEANPPEVTEGCAGGNAGRVTFDHSDSFHPSADQRIVAYQWDVDASDGLWWDTGRDPDFVSPDGQGNLVDNWTYRYLRTGNYTATLRVVDNIGQFKETALQIRVVEADNVRPAAAHGGPYVGEVEGALQLRGQGSDQNLACGDSISVAWDLDDDGDYDDANGASPEVPWDRIAGLPRGEPNPIRIRVRDEAGLEAIAETTLTIYGTEPEARGRANPNPSGCPQEVTFDGSASGHPNPDRTIAEYAWDVDGNEGFDGGGRIFRFTYQRYGTYPITLRVTDDLGRTDEVEFEVEVNQGNQPPVARVSSNNYVVLEGDDVTLDARQSSDANVQCGDEIESYEWDLNGNGEYDDDVDVEGRRVTVEWDTLDDVMEWPADRDSGEPFNTVNLRVTDSFGAATVIQTRVTIFSARPVAQVTQRPDPSPINLQNGFSRTTLDGRESRSPTPGVGIESYQWDYENDGDIDANQPVVEFIRVFDPVPRPDSIPDVDVRLVVTDENGRTGSTVYRINYRVPPTPPTADADPTDPPERGYHILIGQGVRLDGTQSSDPDEEEFGDFIETFRWDLTYDEDDEFDTDFEEAADDADDADAARIDLTAQQLAGAGVDEPGAYVVALQVEDSTNLTNLDTAPLNVYAVNPVAEATANPNPAACRERLTLDARGSNHPHPDIDVNDWDWDLDGDGAYDDATGAQVNHTFNAFGEYEVGLRVTDTEGNSGTTSVDVDVNQGNRAPRAIAGGFRNEGGQVTGPYAIAVGESLQLDATGSSDPDAACEDAVARYEWDVNVDGDFDLSLDQVRPPALDWDDLNDLGIEGPGRYDVRLRVTDGFGLTGQADATLQVVVGPTARATANPNRAGCEQQVIFDGGQSSTDGPEDQGFQIVAYAWDLDADGDFDDAEGARVQRPVAALPDENGDIEVRATLRVTDAAGRTDTDEVVITINVQNLAPVADAGGPYATGRLGGGFAAVRLDGRGSTDPNAPCDEVVRFKWDTDSDGRFGRDDDPDDLEGAQVEYTNPRWQVNTVETIGLVVCDANFECSQPDEADISISEEAPPVGELVSPRAGEGVCQGGGNFDVTLRVSDPEGEQVTATVVINGRQSGQRQVDTPDNGDAVEITIAVNANLVAEGNHIIFVQLNDGAGGRSQVDSGGRITFDRTGPEVDIGRQPGANVCYAANQVPDANPSAEDNLDPAPSLASEVVENGCGRTLRVTATDACGNEGVGERIYLIAEQPEVEIDGAEEGELVANARLSWEVVGPAGCAANSSARLSRNGAAAQNYVANTLVNEAGNYALTVTVSNCQGVARQFIRNFSVNAPPVAVPVPAGHPQADPERELAYVVAEGSGLQLDGSDSRAPEEEDEIDRYRWDFTGDGEFDEEGELVAYPTDEDGVFNGVLEVRDSLGATATSPFRVTVTDVDPVADPGGPYVVAQGAELELDGSGSRPGSAADPISNYVWEWQDGTPNTEGAEASEPTHSWRDNGVYNVRLTVRDEDSSDTEVVRVEVQDVNPNITSIDAPEDPYEIVPMTFTVNVEPGAPGDPLTNVEWDLDEDGNADYRGALNQVGTIQHQFRTAGRHTVTVRVRDRDSSAVFAVNVDVRPITLAELLTWIGGRVAAVLESDDYSQQQKFRLAGVDTYIASGLWAEENNHRGTALIAVDKTITRLRQAQQARVDFGLELWALARTLMREVDGLREDIGELEGGPSDDHPSLERADEFREQVAERFEAEDFEEDARSERDHGVVTELWADAYEAYFWLRDSVAVYRAEGRNAYTLPDSRDPVEVSAAGDVLNDSMALALADTQAEMQDYVDDGDESPGPGRDAISTALETLEEIRELQEHRVINPCPQEERCVTDQEAVELELLGMQLVSNLTAAAVAGAYTRIWQEHLVHMLKFRIELSILRVEFVCGRNSRYAQESRNRQEDGLALVAENESGQALAYYIHNTTRCLIIEVYNGCLVPFFPELNEAIEVPEACAVDE